MVTLPPHLSLDQSLTLYSPAVLFTIVVSILLSLINIGSTIAFNQILSIGICALLGSYLVSISCVAWRRITSRPLLPCSFSLGRWGLPINLLSLAFLSVAWVMSFFPPTVHPTVEGMNWSCLVFGGVMIGAGAYYWGWAGREGKGQYVGPVEYVRKSD
jgi:choline transport protein